MDGAVDVDSTDLDDFVSVTGSSSSIILQMDRAVDVDSTGYLDDLEFDDFVSSSSASYTGNHEHMLNILKHNAVLNGQLFPKIERRKSIEPEILKPACDLPDLE